MLKEFDFKDEIVKNKIKKFLDNNLFSEYNQTIEWNLIRNEKNKFFLYNEDNEGKINWVCSLLDKSNEKEKCVYANRGPVLDYTNKEKIEVFLNEIKIWLIKNGYYKLIINPCINYNLLKNFPSNLKYNLVDKQDYYNLKDSCKLAKVDIIFDENELINKMASGIRRNTKKAYKNNLKTKISNKIDFENFHKLYLETSLRHDFKPHDMDYFKRIYKEFKDNLIFIEVWKENIPIAMGIDIIYNNKLIYIYGASSTEYRKLLGMYEMHWEAIKYCIENKISQYDLGGVFCEEGDIENKDFGLYRLKKGYCYNGFVDIVPDIVINIIKGDKKVDKRYI